MWVENPCMRGFELGMVGGNVEARRAKEALSVVFAGRVAVPVLLDGKDLMGSIVALGFFHAPSPPRARHRPAQGRAGPGKARQPATRPPPPTWPPIPTRCAVVHPSPQPRAAAPAARSPKPA
jgi:hypothetical protein